MTRLRQLVADLPVRWIVEGDPEITDVTIDSRTVRPGSLFVARQGWYVDSHRFLDAAVKAGAAAVAISREDAADATFPIPVLYVEAEDPFLGLVADRHFGHPTDELVVVGITGTNGKTSVSYIVEHLLVAAGHRPAVMGTVNYRFESLTRPAPNTTPDGVIIHRFAREVADAGATALVMEVSSHGLEIGRIGGVAFDAVGFTNLTQDHLDFHKTFDAYRAAKRKLFDEALAFSQVRGKLPIAVAFTDDPEGPPMLDAAPEGVRGISVSLQNDGADLCVRRRGDWSVSGLDFDLVTPGGVLSGTSELVGEHNLANIGVALGLGRAVSPDALPQMVESLERFPGIPGRFELAARPEPSEPPVFVDYAHTPDAVSRALKVFADIGSPDVTVVLGCGGDRDAAKRGPMARAAVDGASRAIFTDDNPRSEESAAILAAMTQGLDHSQLGEVDVIPDRTDAIALAVEVADTRPVLLAGKGHEPYQEIDGVRFHLDDGEETRRILRARSLAADPGDVPLLSGWDVARIARAMRGRLSQRGPRRPIGALSTDTRTVGAGDLFVALKGERFDAHNFLAAAAESGAGTLVVESAKAVPDAFAGSVIVVKDTRAALGHLARALLREARNRRGGLRTIGVTGSNGKTTTKELIAALLRAQTGAGVLATHGNFNNDIGLPLTVSRLTPNHRYAVLEMGTNQPGDIELLASIAHPEVALITSVGAAHLERLGSVEGVREEKGRIVRVSSVRAAIVPHAETGMAPWADWIPPSAELLTFGTGGTLDASRAGVEGEVTLAGDDRFDALHGTYALRLPGVHQASNLAGAVLAASTLLDAALDREVIASVASNVQLPGGRSRVLEIGGRTVIDDAYNANPASMTAALRWLAGRPGERFAVLGDMLELGEHAARLHHQIGAVAAECADSLVAVGPHGRDVLAGADRGVHVADASAASEWLVEHAEEGAQILLKGSRGMKLERIVDALSEAWEGH